MFMSALRGGKEPETAVTAVDCDGRASTVSVCVCALISSLPNHLMCH